MTFVQILIRLKYFISEHCPTACGHASIQAKGRNSKGQWLARQKSFDYYLHPTDRKELIQLKVCNQSNKDHDCEQRDFDSDQKSFVHSNCGTVGTKVGKTNRHVSNDGKLAIMNGYFPSNWPLILTHSFTELRNCRRTNVDRNELGIINEHDPNANNSDESEIAGERD